jgi:hypothetical protein
MDGGKRILNNNNNLVGILGILIGVWDYHPLNIRQNFKWNALCYCV